MHSNFNDLKDEDMTAKEFIEKEGLEYALAEYDEGGFLGIDERLLEQKLEEYHQTKLKLLSIGVVSTRLKMGAKVYKKDKTLTGFIDRKADVGFNHWIVIWENGEQTKEYGSDLNVC